MAKTSFEAATYRSRHDDDVVDVDSMALAGVVDNIEAGEVKMTPT